MKRKKNKNLGVIFMSVFISLLMVTSIIGYIFGDRQKNVINYNKLKFTLTNSGWETKYEGKKYTFSYVPSDIEDMEYPVDFDFSNVLEVDTTYDPESKQVENIARSIYELSNIMTSNGKYVREGFLFESEYDMPIITCADASDFVPVILYKLGNESMISQNGNCIIIESTDGNNFMAYSDRIAYDVLGIME